jgi:hypothetical protein
MLGDILDAWRGSETHTGSDAMRKKKSKTAHIRIQKPRPLLYSAVSVPKAPATPKPGVIIAPNPA